MESKEDLENLRSELVGLFEYMQRVRKEIAAIHNPADEDNQFETMAEQLDAIVGATEDATNTIMEMVEKNEDALSKLRTKLDGDAEGLALLNEISGHGMTAMEACSFQDITGQRVNKVIKSITYVEKRVNALTAIWGKEELEKIEVESEKKTEDEKLLHGPALDPQASISQDEIDKLFD